MENTKKEEFLFFMAFNNLINFTFERYKLLMKKFSDLETAFYSNYSDLLEAGLDQNLVQDFIIKRKKFNLNEAYQKVIDENLKICVITDPDYPFLLKNIYSPPPLLYYRGNLDIDWKASLSVVGSRRFTYYGEKIVKNLLPGLARAGIAIVSGLAIGIDSLVHLDVVNNGGRTIAVLGSGLDYLSVYPRSNRELFEKIISSDGLVLSEFPPGTDPVSFNFPQRNRIIAGLSRATLVVEAGKKSGSLITARYALDEGREVFSVPGSIYDDNFLGSNNLIKNGASVVLELNDIFDFFNVLPLFEGKPVKQAYIGENDLEKAILSLLELGKHHIDEIFEALPYNISEISSTLVILEMRGFVKDIGGKNYQKA
ncbi:MAG: DNA-processing protein DprA [Patescibacteria group bacterium]|nr:DNA-processing protein DprA [Patescibacteria group bacterium]